MKEIKIEEDIKMKNPLAWDVLTKAWKYKPLTSEENEYYIGSKIFFLNILCMINSVKRIY